jgi:hypothetical protein
VAISVFTDSMKGRPTDPAGVFGASMKGRPTDPVAAARFRGRRPVWPAARHQALGGAQRRGPGLESPTWHDGGDHLASGRLRGPRTDLGSLTSGRVPEGVAIHLDDVRVMEQPVERGARQQ